MCCELIFFFSSRRRHTRSLRDWSSDVCSSDLARQALQLAGDDPVILANAAFVLANFGEEIGAMMALVDRALAITPSFSRGWFYSGVLRLWASQHDLAIEHAETALRLSPRRHAAEPDRRSSVLQTRVRRSGVEATIIGAGKPGLSPLLPRSRRVLRPH